MKVNQYYWALVFSLLFVGLSSASPLNLSQVPLYLGGSVKPNVMVMLDNSGSMKSPMYHAYFGIRPYYDSSADYYGIFETEKNYKYDPDFPINTGAYHGTAIDVTKTGSFYEDLCTPASGDNICWSGRYLNWLTMRRTDASRVALVGGKLESRTAYNYGSGYRYKVIANNERSDEPFGGQIDNSDEFSPIPNNSVAWIKSPANDGTEKVSYDPYAKITLGNYDGLIHDKNNDIIGEFGRREVIESQDGQFNLAVDSWTTVSFRQTYNNPVVIAKPPARKYWGLVLVRIKDVTSTSFKVSLQSWPYIHNGHAPEKLSYMVVEAGTHTLASSTGDKKLVAGKTSTNQEYADYSANNCGIANRTDFTSTSFGTTFSSTPVVIASTTTHNISSAVNARAFEITNNNFKVALQREENTTSTLSESEEISYIAIEPSTVIDETNGWKMTVGNASGINNTTTTVIYPEGVDFDEEPMLLTGMTTINDADPAVLRLYSNSKTGFELKTEEEQSCNDELIHANESIGYFALEPAILEYNIALAVADEPTGLLHDISTDVRLGVSFYHFDPNKMDIYNSNSSHGGTLRFKLPNNPFVKTPSTENGGGYRELNGYINSPLDDIVDAIEHYPLIWGTTPLAENLWDVIQYFEQDEDTEYNDDFKVFEPADGDHPEIDPYSFLDENNNAQDLWCAKSSVIIFTDGDPYTDAHLPDEILDYDDDGAANDDVNRENVNAHGRDNLDDVAYWAYCDKSKDSGSCFDDPTAINPTAINPSRDLRDDLEDDQFLHVHAVGFANGSVGTTLRDTVRNAGGQAYPAADGRQLESALIQAFEAAKEPGSSASVALNSGSISGGSKIFQARFDSEDWSGQLLSLPVVVDTSTAQVSLGTSVWDAADEIPVATDRVIVTFDGSDGQPFRWSNMSTDQKTQLNNDETLLNFIRGDQTNEVQGNGTDAFRNRDSLLGDIVHSSPKYLGPPSARYPDSWGTVEVEGTMAAAPENAKPYSAFKSSHINRNELIYVGANDGMLHAFNAETGVEQFSYIPKSVFNNLNNLSQSNYEHKYFVDGQITIVDVFFDSDDEWHTVLVGALGGGGQGLFALDVTNPTDFDTEANAAAKVLWEFTDADSSNLGNTLGEVSIVRLRNGQWVAVFGNGYNNTISDDNVSSSGNAVLYMVDIETGEQITQGGQTIEFDTEVGFDRDPTGTSRPNGMSSPAVVDTDGDFIADTIYAGDLFGNLWKVDLTGNINQWDFTYQVGSPAKPQPLFTACAGTECSTTNSQPITTQPQVVLHPNLTGYLVYFGTGKYFEVGDNTSVSQTAQSFYSVWDKLASQADFNVSSPSRSNMLEQSIIFEKSIFNFDVRVTTANSIDWSTHNGWYMDLFNKEDANTDNHGERQVSNSVIRNGRVIFTTLVPLEDICEPGGTSWLLELDMYSGSRLLYSPFDLNGDRIFNSAEYVSIGDIDGDGNDDYVPVSGKKSTVGIIPTPSIVNSEGGAQEYKFASGSSGNVEITTENPGPTFGGRQSWRQLEFNF